MEASEYRIKKILDIQNSFEKTKEDRRKTLKKYSKVLNIIDGTDVIFQAATMGMGATGVILLSTIVSIPVAIILEGISIGTGFFSITLKYIKKRLQHKADKHQKIVFLLESKLNTIQNHISKALEDGKISDEEFKLILDEEVKFREIKDEIRKKPFKSSKK